MNSIEVREFSQAIRNFIKGTQLPAEVKRLALAEILRETEEDTRRELIAQVEERDRKEGEQDAEGVQPNSVGE